MSISLNGSNNSLSSIKVKNLYQVGNKAQLFKSFEFGNGSRISDENLVILEFKYLQNKKW